MAASTQKSPPKRMNNAKSKSQVKKKNPPKKQIKQRSKHHSATTLWERLGAGILCFLSAMFLLLNLFGVEALVVDLIAASVKGCVGYGFFISIPALLLVAYLLIFRAKERVALRIWCTLLLPVFFGALFHVFLDNDLYVLSIGGLERLWTDGTLLSCGGVTGGFLAVLFTQLFSSIGACFLFLLATLTLVLGALHITPQTVVHALREAIAHYQDSRVYDNWEEDEDFYEDSYEDEFPPHASSQRVQSSIDLPMDDPPLLEQKQRQRQEPPVRRGLFNKRPKVKPPHELLSDLARGRRTQNTPPPPDSPPPAEEPNFDPPVLSKAEPVFVPPIAPKPEPIFVPPIAPKPEPIFVPPIAPKPGPIFAPPIVTAPAPANVTPAAPGPVVLPISFDRESSKADRRELICEHQAAVAKDVESVLEATACNEYRYPSINLLHEAVIPSQDAVQEELIAIQKRLSVTISSFGIVANITGAVRGPSITRYELELEQGTRLNKLTNLADDIALALGASSVRIAPVPGKISLVGIEVPNKKVTPVPIREVLASDDFTEHKSKVSFSVGKDIGGNYIIGDIARLPHLLIAGTTGSGKSVCTNSLIISMLYKATPDEVRLIMVDPKMVELGIYNGIPHLLIPVVTDPKKAAGALQWAVVEMMKRYRIFSEVGVRDLGSYNAYAARSGSVAKLPQIVVVIDELADLMLVAAKEVEESICRVAQMGRASGMHLIIATQRPSADVITGLMKANIPSRIAFAVASSLESRIILDTQGAEKLVGKGDMLWAPLGAGKPLRVQGCLIDDEDVAAVVAFVKATGATDYDDEVLHEIEQHAKEQGKGSKSSGSSAASSSDTLSDGGEDDYDELFSDAVTIVLEMGQASVSMLQRRLKLGYSRAARLVDQMEDRGIVGPFEGSKPRQLLVSREQWNAMQGKVPVAAPAVIPPPPPPPLPLPLLVEHEEEDENNEDENDLDPFLEDLPPWNEEEV